MVNIIPANQPFYPTDHCGVIRLKGEYLSLYYIASELLAIGKEKRFSRTFRASTERIKDIRIQMPSEKLQKDFDKKVETILSKIKVIEADLSLIDNEKKQLLKKHLE
jgi:type I restriction enzyme M protein